MEGKVEETGVIPSTAPPSRPTEAMPVPVLPPKAVVQGKKLHGKADKTSGHLEGQVKEDAMAGEAEDDDLQSQTGKMDPTKGPLKGSASKVDPNLQAGVAEEDPDSDDRELMIEWDRWRNRLLHAIQSGMNENLNNASADDATWDQQQKVMRRFPLGTTAWFSCQVTPDKQIIHIKLVRPSGYKSYDKAVLDAIDSLQGDKILVYPRGSRRQIVTQIAGIKTAEQTEWRNFHFGDVEHQRVPGNQ